MKPDLVISDFAGTLMLEEGAVANAYREAFAELDITISDQDINARRGANKLGVFRELVAETHHQADVEQLARTGLARFQAELERSYREQPVEPIPGAHDALLCLHDAGIRIGVSSGFPRDLMENLIDRLGWAELFDAAVSGDDVPAGRPAPYIIFKAMMDLDIWDVRLVAVVGDTALDLEAGVNAGVGWVIGVLSGAHDLAILGQVQHTHLLQSVATLPDMFDL